MAWFTQERFPSQVHRVRIAVLLTNSRLTGHEVKGQYRCISINENVVEKFIYSCKLFQKIKLSYILDSLHVK